MVPRYYFIILIVIVLSYRPTLFAQNIISSELKSCGAHLLIEGDVGGDFYRSPSSPLYSTNQLFYAGTIELGYSFNPHFFAGMGGGIRHCENDQKTSFPIAASFLAYGSGRYIFSDVKLRPFADVRGGVVVYPKWNGFIKPYAAIGGGVHLLPRITTGGRFAFCGTLDNRHTTELSIFIGFCL